MGWDGMGWDVLIKEDKSEMFLSHDLHAHVCMRVYTHACRAQEEVLRPSYVTSKERECMSR
jgi:hypothetical protein